MLRQLQSPDFSVLLVSLLTRTTCETLTYLVRVISLAFETLLFTLTIGKFLDGVRQGWGKAVMVQQFIADGTWAYALIFLVMLVNMMFYKYVHSELTRICYTCVVHCPYNHWKLTASSRSQMVACGLVFRRTLSDNTLDLPG